MIKRELSWPWNILLAVQDIPPEGRQHHLVADASARAAIARFADVPEVLRLEADMTVTPHGSDGVHVTGQVSATVGQVCVVTLEPMRSEVREDIDILFLREPPDTAEAEEDDGEEPGKIGDERIEALQGGTIDLGAIATEFLMLGIDPYPRKPDAKFAAPSATDEASPSPFAVLAALKKGPSDNRD